MKNVTKKSIAKKYARAWFNIFGDELTKDSISAFSAASNFLKNNTRILFFLRLGALKKEIKIDGLNALNRQFSLPKSLDAMSTLLVEENRSFLYAEVLGWIITLFKRKNRIAHFTIESACPLNATDLRTIQEFLASKTESDIIYDSQVNKALIAGIRVQSESLLWEHSLAQQLRRMQAAALQ